MNLQKTADDWAVEKYAVGQPVPRTEDPILVRGAGRYTDDVSLPGQAYAVIVRSRHAHGIIHEIDTAAARAMPGVLGVYTGADLEALRHAQMHRAVQEPRRLADEEAGAAGAADRQGALRRRSDRLRGGGNAAAGEGRRRSGRGRHRAAARRDSPAQDAARPGAPQLYDDAPGNVALDYHYGDAEQVEAAFAKAAHVTRLKLVNSRVVVNAMEPRAAVGAYDTASASRCMSARRACSACAATSRRCSRSSRSRCTC